MHCGISCFPKTRVHLAAGVLRTCTGLGPTRVQISWLELVGFWILDQDSESGSSSFAASCSETSVPQRFAFYINTVRAGPFCHVLTEDSAVSHVNNGTCNRTCCSLTLIPVDVQQQSRRTSRLPVRAGLDSHLHREGYGSASPNMDA